MHEREGWHNTLKMCFHWHTAVSRKQSPCVQYTGCRFPILTGFELWIHVESENQSNLLQHRWNETTTKVCSESEYALNMTRPAL